MSQSAVSRQVSALEQELGTPPLPPPRARADPDRRGRAPDARGARHHAEARERARAARRFARPADGHAARHDDGRPRLDLAHVARQRVPRPLSGHPPGADPRRFASSTSPCARPTWRSGCARRRSPTSSSASSSPCTSTSTPRPPISSASASRRRADDIDKHRIVVFGENAPTYLKDDELAVHRRPRAGQPRGRRRSRSTASWRSAARWRRASASPCCRTTWSARNRTS